MYFPKLGQTNFQGYGIPSDHLISVYGQAPAAFGYNVETARDNLYQIRDDRPSSLIQKLALNEFNQFVQLLRAKESR
ncbi:arginine deiminase-related protein [Echinicola jeungdonensis]|nr:arginine deiminase-related protein [Echinicola jeungdonensis]MDN3671210.1 arginine deiminase-related protein [Echinicola jeungdonensis]